MMSLNLAILLLTLSLLSHAQADVAEEPVTRACSVSGQPTSLSISCTNITDFSAALPSLTPTKERVFSLRITKSRHFIVTRADMDSPAFATLQWLILSECGITSCNSEPYRGLTHLHWINLENNYITEIHADTFAGLEHLKRLDLSHNQIATIDAAAFKDCRHLTSLMLSNNKIDSIVEHLFQGLDHLFTLKLANNLLTSIDERTFNGLSTLEELIISGNNIKIFGVRAFHSLTWLRRLEAGLIKLESLDSKLFENNHNLFELFLSSTNLAHTDKFSFNSSSLEALIINNCNITNITAAFFEHLPNLKKVNLDSNHLTKVDDNLFTHLPELRIASIQNNNLTSLSVSSFNQIYQILKRPSTPFHDFGKITIKPDVLMNRNPWNCQAQEMTELHEWMVIHNMKFEEFFDCN